MLAICHYNVITMVRLVAITTWFNNDEMSSTIVSRQMGKGQKVIPPPFLIACT
jgi:hypothetical protein